MAGPEDWIDELAARWEGVGDGKGGQVRSYRSYEADEFPEALGDFPCAITYVTEMRSEYSEGGPAIDHYVGVTEFHLFPNAAKTNIPKLMLYYARIRSAAAGDMQLAGKVNIFLLRQDVPSIQGPLVLRYGTEEPHHGLIVNWRVKHNVTGTFTVSR